MLTIRPKLPSMNNFKTVYRVMRYHDYCCTTKASVLPFLASMTARSQSR